MNCVEDCYSVLDFFYITYCEAASSVLFANLASARIILEVMKDSPKHRRLVICFI